MKSLRQGCPLSPTLFIYVIDLEEKMKKEQEGGIVIGKEKFWTISYADDVILLARRESELKEMIKRFKKCLEKKGLNLSLDKLKILVFEKGRGRMKKKTWRWGEKDIEEVKKMKYLGYILQKNGGAEKHIRERIRKATIAMKKTWSIGERIFKENYRARMKMFESLVENVALYGAEIWGWQYENRLDIIKRKYVKWILGLDRGTPNYTLLEETKMREIRMKAIRRAMRYEDKARNTSKKLVQECITDLEKEKPEGEEGKWENKRKELLGKAETSKELLRNARETEDQNVVENLVNEIERKEIEERQRKINDSRYNNIYKDIGCT